MLALAGCPPDTGTSASDPSSSTGSTSDVSDSSGSSTQVDPTGDPTTGDPTTGDPTTGDPTTGDPTTGGETAVGDARVFYTQRGEDQFSTVALRFVAVEGGVASPPTTVITAPDGIALAVTREAQNRWLAVNGSGDGDAHLWLVDPATATAHEVPVGAEFDVISHPTFSHDGEHMLFAGGIQNQQFDLYVCKIDAGTCVPEQFSPPLDPMTLIAGADPVFSADDTRVAYSVHQPEGGAELVIAELASPGSATPIMSFPAVWTDFTYAFAPDGKTLYYAADITENNIYEFFAVDISADPPGFPVPFTPTPDVQVRARFAPDMSALLWWSGSSNYGNLYRIPLAGTIAGTPQLLNTTGPKRAYTGHFTWTEDSEQVVFLADHEQLGINELYLVDASGGKPAPVKLNAPIAPGGEVDRPHLTPLPTKIMYTANVDANTGKELFLASLDAPGEVVKLNDPLPPGGELRGDFTWTAGGERLLYVGSQEVAGTNELFMIDFTTAAPPVKLNDPLPPGGAVGFYPDFASDGRRVVFTAGETLGAQVLYTVALADDGQPAPPVLLSAPDEFVRLAFVLPPA